jgi:hypothetical protein
VHKSLTKSQNATVKIVAKSIKQYTIGKDVVTWTHVNGEATSRTQTLDQQRFQM